MWRTEPEGLLILNLHPIPALTRKTSGRVSALQPIAPNKWGTLVRNVQHVSKTPDKEDRNVSWVSAERRQQPT